MRPIFLLVFLCCLISLSADSQTMMPRRSKRGTVPPKALLVTILTRQRQHEYLKQNRPELLPEFDRDVTEVAKRTVKDFSLYFKFCPVYFFIDSMSDKIALGEFEGVLLDSSLQPIPNPVLSPSERNFYIAHYGSPFPQPDSVRPANSDYIGGAVDVIGDDPTALFREKLLVADSRFRLLSKAGPRTNFVRANRPSGMGMREFRSYRQSLVYNAKRWFIDYLPVAYSYDQTLRRYFRTN